MREFFFKGYLSNYSRYVDQIRPPSYAAINGRRIYADLSNR